MANSNINTGVNSLLESINRLKSELQEYHDNASKGMYPTSGLTAKENRRRNMVLLAWDIRKMERELKALTTRTKSVNSIMNQANRLMSAAGLNLNRVNLIRSIAFRYYDNIRECAGKFNYNDDAEFTKPYTRAQYMTNNAHKHTAILKRYNISQDPTFMYMLLSRLATDCKAYIQNKFPQKHLWAGNISEQINIIRALWHSVPVAPEWLTMEQIENYAKLMHA